MQRRNTCNWVEDSADIVPRNALLENLPTKNYVEGTYSRTHYLSIYP